MSRLVFLLGFLFPILTGKGQQHFGHAKANQISRHDSSLSCRAAKFEFPKISPDDKIIEHTGFSLLYDEIHEQAKWVAYELTAEETRKSHERTNKFLEDPFVKTGSATDLDYKGSGYDRGHLAPASDMGWSEITMAESFYYSNMSPQDASCNRGIWKRGEDLVRNWTVENQALYIVTGPVLKKGLKTIGPNNVSVPEFYYKVILDYKEPELKGLAFLIPNEGSNEPLQSFVVTIDSVQSLTGIDFFPSLSNENERVLEKKLCIECWTWGSSSIKHPGSSRNRTSNKFSQCLAVLTDGNNCKNNILGPLGYCAIHKDFKQKNPANR